MSFRNTAVALAAAALFLAGSSMSVAQEAAKSDAQQGGQKSPPNYAPQRPVPIKQPQSGNPPQNLARPQPVRPATSDVPKPTVTLKEGEVPVAKFDTPVYDFGRVRAGQEVLHDYWFTNTGTGPLEILRVKPSCGCTAAGEYDRIVMPNETGKIPIKVNIGHSAGPITKSITISTNAPAEGQITLQIKGEVWQPIQATPLSASFGRLTAEEAAKPLERKLTIVNNTEEMATLTDVKCTTKFFTASVVPLESGKKFELTVAIVPPLKPGVASGSIEMVTGVKDSPKLTIPASAFVTADVEVTPNQLTLPANRTDKLQRQFFVRNNSKNPVKISDLKATSDKLALSIVETQPIGMAYRISLDIPADYQPSATGDKITFKTDNASVPEISLPVYGARPPANVAAQFERPPATGIAGAKGPMSPAQVLQLRTEERQQAKEAAQAAEQAKAGASGAPGGAGAQEAAGEKK